MSLCIRALTDADLDASEALATLAYGRRDTWRSDIKLYLKLEPDGCYVATLDDRVVGMGGGINYGPFTWIGLMGVHPDEQGHGIGRAILDHILSWTTSQHCPTTVLDASAAGASLYTHAGFVDQGTTVLFERTTNFAIAGARRSEVSVCSVTDLAPLVAFDHRIFGADRSRVLTALFDKNPNRVFLARNSSGTITGYAIAQSRRIGPWLAHSSQQAEALLATMLSQPFSVPPVVYAPSQNSDVSDLLSHHGFAHRRALRHMCRGPHVMDQDRTNIYGQGSFSIG